MKKSRKKINEERRKMGYKLQQPNKNNQVQPPPRTGIADMLLDWLIC